MRTLERILLVLVIVLILAGAYVALRYIDFFNIEEVDVSVSGPVTNVSIDMQRLIKPIKGRNIFEVNLNSLEKELEAFDGVGTVKARRYFPNRIIIQIDYNDITLRAYSIGSSDTISYYFIHEDVMDEVSAETWESFDKLSIVELNPAYAQMVMKWGADDGFRDMVKLAEHLSSNNLITNIKYDNNNGSDFGRLAIELSS
ncbi:MAG: FtsQ-type POTRA domain-containing protein, partial [Spirochaetales bacterium]|nr:FtsQ-type POTRA domain-containing protein [Spirochaetales bacterium]